MKLSRLKCVVMNFPKNMLCLQGFHCFIIGLLRHCSVLIFVCLFLCFLRHYTISSMFLLFHYLFVTSPYHLIKISIASSFFVTSLLCSMLRLSLPLFLTSLFYLFKVSIVSLSVCYVTALF